MKFTPHNIGTFLVESRSEPGSHHILDINEKTCSCKGFEINKTCEHLKAIMSDTETQELALVPEGEHAQIETLRRVDTPWEEFESKIPALESSVYALVVTKENHLVLSSAARAIRLKVRGTRIDVEHKREELVEDLNKRTKAINTAARSLKERLEGMEEKLLEQEKFAENEAARLLLEKREARIAEITPFLSAPPMVDLGLVDDSHYAGMLSDAKGAHAAKLAREHKEREEAEAKAKAEAEERERIRVENERLKKEAAEREAAAKVEREAAAAKLREAQEKAERERKEAAEKARKERQEIEAKAKAEREAAELVAKKEREEAASENARLAKIAEQERQKAATAAREARESREAQEKQEAQRKAAEEAERKRIADEAAKAAKAPDKEKLLVFASTIRSIEIPEFTTDEADQIGAKLNENLLKLAGWIESKAGEL